MSCCRPSHEQKRERPFAALRVTLLERGPGCHPERSAGSLRQARQTLRGVYPERSEWAQGDSHSLQTSQTPSKNLTGFDSSFIL